MEQPSLAMTVPEMYREVYHLNTSGVDGYDSPKKYADPLRQIKDRAYLSQKKGQKVGSQKIPPRPNYLDEAAKQASYLPPPGKYNVDMPWPRKSAHSLKKEVPHKKSYLDEIIGTAKRLKFPAPGQYNTFKSQKEIDDELKKLKNKKVESKTKINFLDEVQFESNLVPGPGNYNPRQVTKRLSQKPQPTPEDWRKKAKQLESKKPEKSPNMQTYNPKPADFGLFGSPNKSCNTAKNLWGREERFKTEVSAQKNGKSKQGKGGTERVAVPGPGHYQMIHLWKGKEERKDKKPRDYMDVMSKSTSKSVYY